MSIRFRKRNLLVGCLPVLLGVAGLAAMILVMVMGDDGGVSRATIRDLQGRAISYLRAGNTDSPRIIYVHGSPGNARAWLDYVKLPIPGYESIAFDRPGFGQTTPPDPDPSLEGQAQAIEPFLIERDGRWPVLVGHSFGAPVACRAAVDYRDRVGGLVIVSGALDPGLEKKRWRQRIGEFWLVPKLLPRPLRNSNRELIPLRGELEELAPLLANIRCPTIILHGKVDALVPVSNVAFLTEHLPAEVLQDVVVFENRNHLIPWSESVAIRSAIQNLGVAP
jgi:pimeloyl-ACP methyl ester carboxylesterase